MRKILIAEDDFFIRDVYGKTFSLAGFEVVLVADGLDAITQIKNQSFDIILLDIMMPKMSGLQVLRALRVLDSPVKNTPVFMITNLGQQNIIEEAFQAGMDGYIIKSEVTPQQMLEEINTFFNNKVTTQTN